MVISIDDLSGEADMQMVKAEPGSAVQVTGETNYGNKDGERDGLDEGSIVTSKMI